MLRNGVFFNGMKSVGKYVFLFAAWTFLGSGTVMNDRLAVERRFMGIDKITNLQSFDFTKTSERVEKSNIEEKESIFARIFDNKQANCPYGHLAKDGIIDYNGVIFVCDYKTNTLCLGDVTSNPKDVLNISLPSGGNLKVNVNNFGDLSKAAGMFSAEDLNAIMRAIAQYDYCTSKLNEIDEENEEIVENAAEQDNIQNETIEYNDEINLAERLYMGRKNIWEYQD